MEIFASTENSLFGAQSTKASKPFQVKTENDGVGLKQKTVHKSKRRVLGDISNDGHRTVPRGQKTGSRAALGNISNLKPLKFKNSAKVAAKSSIKVPAVKPLNVDDDSIEICERRPEKEHEFVDPTLNLSNLYSSNTSFTLQGAKQSIEMDEVKLQAVEPCLVVEEDKDMLDDEELPMEDLNLDCDLNDIVIDDLLLDVGFVM